MCSLYAPNGTLKTSLAKVLKDIEEERQSKDIIFPERATKRLVTLDGQPVDAGQIMVINSYDESYSSKQVSTLLVIRLDKFQFYCMFLCPFSQRQRDKFRAVIHAKHGRITSSVETCLEL